MEFHGTRSALISMTRAVPWNSKEFHGIKNAPISMPRAVTWNSMEFEVRQFRWHDKFHGIPWNLRCANSADTSSSLEFHGTWNAPISLTRAVPWNSMEFHGIWCATISLTRAIPLNLGCVNFADTSSGIPWNLKCANFADTSSSMEFHVIPYI